MGPEIQPMLYLPDFPGGSDGKVSVYNVETWVRSLGLEDLLEKEMAIHSSTIAWKILWTELYLSSDLIWLGGCNYPMEGSHMG